MRALCLINLSLRRIPCARHLCPQLFVQTETDTPSATICKRLSTPDCLTAEEIGKLVRKLDGVYYVTAFVAALTGLRVSELPTLKWEDIDFGVAEIHLTSAIVCQHVGPLETAASQKPAPMDAGLAARCYWTGVRSVFTIKRRIMSLRPLRNTPSSRCGLAQQCQNTFGLLQRRLGS